MVAAPLEQTFLLPEEPGQQPKPSPKQRPARRLKPYARVVWLGICTVLLAWQCLAQQAAVLERSYEVARLQAELADLEEQILRLTVEKARLASLARVEQVARTQLGMVHPEEVHVVRVPSGGSATSSLPLPAQADGEPQGWWQRVLAWFRPESAIVRADEGHPTER
ncbi:MULTISPECIES: septum formation initiator family protein [Limnochorda]|uniref:septum formation initiator family protein n=1 Tax=Limnochorda TaxID=1676651 RepID=UPI001D9BF0CA|nr:septum formation initiator family protein [Limnochorda pilosa]MBO2486383.1 hypothetical protein [Bacillota bacterium]MBO2518764.1 hypothetical protein [Bacillota bacterium]